MKRRILFWILAVIITIASAVYQRMTGPTYPLSGSVNLNGQEIKYQLERSQESTQNYLIEINTDDESINGILFWKKHNSNDEFTRVQMHGNKTLTAELPVQKRLEKLDYYIQLSKGDNIVAIPNKKLVTIRFKDHVPMYALIPHIFFMFFAMMLSTRTGLEFFNKEPQLKKLTLWTIIFLFIGGFPLGFVMNGLAFGEMWGGWPFGNDVTDNKTQIALIIWLTAFYFVNKNKYAKIAVLIAAVVMLAVYLIPHSV
jgi:hypothetical protein